MPTSEQVVGVFGGSGLYEIPGLEGMETRRVETPFGEPSDEYVIGHLGDTRLIFLPRHGRGHRLMPAEVNYRANVWGMKSLGASSLLAVSAVGSMRKEIEPGHVVVPDQFFDRTRLRAHSFFGEGVAAHVGFADPVCAGLSALVADAAEASGAVVHRGGTYICMEGPAFSTRAESRIYRQWGVDVIGMTNIPEAKLAREAELCFATLALSTDYDCWHEDEADVSVEGVLAILRENVSLARRTVAELAGRIPAEAPDCACRNALAHAIMTDPAAIAPHARERLGLLIDRHLPPRGDA
jgi:5'-methylthioadenosine phosphorylase